MKNAEIYGQSKKMWQNMFFCPEVNNTYHTTMKSNIDGHESRELKLQISLT